MVDKQELDEIKFKNLSTGLKTFVVLGWISIVCIMFYLLMVLFGIILTIKEAL